MPESVVPPEGSQFTSDEAPGTGPLPYVERIVATLGQFNIAIPIAFELTRTLIGLFRELAPDAPLPTDAEVIARLRATAQQYRDSDEAWLREHGYLS